MCHSSPSFECCQVVAEGYVCGKPHDEKFSVASFKHRTVLLIQLWFAVGICNTGKRTERNEDNITDASIG